MPILLLLASTHSAPGAPVFYGNSLRDSDCTAQEQSDAPPYEWDDYNVNIFEQQIFFSFLVFAFFTTLAIKLWTQACE